MSESSAEGVIPVSEIKRVPEVKVYRPGDPDIPKDFIEPDGSSMSVFLPRDMELNDSGMDIIILGDHIGKIQTYLSEIPEVFEERNVAGSIPGKLVKRINSNIQEIQ